ncbi:HNH endonuclease signature motif containing protein [Arthrobacter sp. zg-Y1219]|uniref:HNH endonuclease signature motif containing protein n=1 Tax=Arthrobacter sp. zg-Y1219 TaxID=3049067 RepID=UPI0024C23B43|nr:HNH endonuclease signature motif containing protein [Arthrobacter sp. zg-Y1219]
MSRTVDYLQIVCAQALETHRVTEAFGANSPVMPAPADGQPAWNNTWAQPADFCAESGTEQAAGKVRREFRSTADYMRCRLRINRAEAQRRLRLAASLLPSISASGQPVPAALPALAEATACGVISSAGAMVVANAVDEIRHRTEASVASAIEADLSALAARQDGDFLVRAARRWVLLVDQDGAEPTDEELRRFQGVFSGRKKNGLNHLNIYCTDDQHETLLTVMNAAAGPRVADGSAPDPVIAGSAERGDGTPPDPATASRLNRSTRPQRLLGGLVDAAKAALSTGGVPASGGTRPQVLVTIDSASLLQKLDFGSVLKPMDGPEPASHSVRPGNFAFSGPVPAAAVRKLACDADLLPVVLSGEGRILDIGRAQRLFPPHLRKALHARDGGCAFPGCTIPGPWTEAHHIRYWNVGGPTSADNGVLLCSHHHHEVHKENWRIEVKSGVPWFVPPSYVDPDRIPLRNTFFRADPGSGSGCMQRRMDTTRISRGPAL